MDSNKNKIIFIDIDGPMIPMRAYLMAGQTKLVSVFDPCAVGLVNRLIRDSGAKVVVSSTWRGDGYDKCAALFAKNGIDPAHFHEDWATPQSRMSDSRTTEIMHWLDNHPEVTTYVALDDEMLCSEALPYCVKCDTYEGFSWRNYIECKLYLGILQPDTDKDADTQFAGYKHEIAYFKAKEVQRILRRSERGPTGYISQLCDAILKPKSEEAT